MDFDYRIEPIAECSILIVFEHEPNAETSQLVRCVSDALQAELAEWLMNITPSYNTILIDYLPHRISIFDFCTRTETLINSLQPQLNAHSDTIELPAYYDLSVGPDLTLYFDRGLSLEDVIRLHSDKQYTVGAIGFAPGFAFLTEVDPQLKLPRKDTPRLSLPKGSIAIAEKQTAVYPDSSPGGWNVIGNCPLVLYSPNQEPMIPFTVGQKVRFKPISQAEFIELGGTIHKEDFV
ncbi:5-oxoprolinase subunit B family protein [Vibrio sp. V39_P1S14PM300]|uniref:5-oxoprolinase subunit B family protein n=1 Tax=Vibrio sp. V39_P1S14PM300 TaxID=1938690 RepID=UPI001372F35C|nr:allophanate hydrolase subunit 1 [Vibrio sp. V39_P1S14PM300]NAX21758.1 carboxyltransferase domain-containing protein [Vibrio sp. V39_P1S14PM300]